MDASKRTADKNQQMIYANILMQQQQLDLGILGKITYRGGSSGGGADYTNTIGAITQGIITTPLAQQQLIIQQFTRSLPVPPVILVFYGYRVTTYASGLASPQGITIDPINNLYVTEIPRIYKIDTNGTPSIVAGQLGTGATDNVFGTNAQFNLAIGITIDSARNLYVCDRNNNAIRKIGTNGMVTTYVSGIATPNGITIDSAGNLYVCETTVHRIRKIGTNAMVTTIAGRTGAPGTTDAFGTNAQFFSPNGITIDSAGNLYVCDYSNHRIRKIEPDGRVTTIAGSTVGTNDNVIGTNAQFRFPNSITIDSAGNLYVCDFNNNRIRKIGTNGMVTTIAGQLTSGTTDNVIGTNAQFSSPSGITIDSTGNLYVSDRGNNSIRKLTPLYEESR